MTFSDRLNVAVLIVNIVGALAALVAIILALIAYKAIAKERRVVFELEILRQMLSEGVNYNGVDAPHKRAMLACLPPGDLPLWRLVMREFDAQRAAPNPNAVDIRGALREAVGTDEQPGAAAFDLVVSRAMADEVREAILHRVPRR